MSPPEAAPSPDANVDLIDFRLFEARADGTIHEGVYGVSVSRVREVAPLPSVEPVPDAHPAVIGLFHSRGEQVPVLHLSRWMRIDEAPPVDIRPKVIVCEVDGHVLGLLVHQASRIRSVPWASVLPPPPLIRQQHGTTISATTRIDGERTLLVVDVEAIVSGVLGLQDESLPETPVASRNRRILITDDSATVRARMRRILESSGYRVDEAEDGAAALQHLQALSQHTGQGARTAPPDLLITDVEMPRRSGFDLVRALRAEAAWQSLPIIMQTSLAGAENERRGRDAGCDEYLVKFDADVLLQAVARLLPD